ncbi:hypothetical protein AM593_00044, partial [Mytilus galloprovincialis]
MQAQDETYIHYNDLMMGLAEYKVSDIRTSARDEESIMVIKLRRLFQCGKRGDSDKMKELKLRLRHHLPHEILQPGKEFQEVFDALTLKNKIALGEYSFLCDVFSEIHMEAGMITQDYQAKIIHILGQQISEQKKDSLVDKKTVVSRKLSIKKIEKIVEEAVQENTSELDEEFECQDNIRNMAQVALYEGEKNMTAEEQ